MSVESALIGLGSFYPLLEPAPRSMVALQYCGMMHMPCLSKPHSALPDTSPWLPDHLDLDKGVAFYDYFLVRSPPPRLNLFSKHKVELVARRGSWSLYRREGVQ